MKFALGLVLLLSLISVAFFVTPVVASPDEVKWSRVNIPADGRAGNWVLANGANIHRLAMSSDGTLYCYANPSGTSYTLFKSTDTGYNWSAIGMVTDNMTDIATAADNASIIYYATAFQCL